MGKARVQRFSGEKRGEGAVSWDCYTLKFVMFGLWKGQGGQVWSPAKIAKAILKSGFANFATSAVKNFCMKIQRLSHSALQCLHEALLFEH